MKFFYSAIQNFTLLISTKMHLIMSLNFEFYSISNIKEKLEVNSHFISVCPGIILFF